MSGNNTNAIEAQSCDLPAFSRGLDQFIIWICKAAAWLNAILAILICTQVVLRYVFNINSVAMEEFQWHLYGVAALFGMSYCTVIDQHIRLDLAYQFFSPRTKAIVEALGILIFVLPMVFVMVYHGVGLVESAWKVGESSRSPMGLCCRWAIKAVIPVSFSLLGLAALSRLYRSVYLLVKGRA